VADREAKKLLGECYGLLKAGGQKHFPQEKSFVDREHFAAE
jgi:hypothetical protein